MGRKKAKPTQAPAQGQAVEPQPVPPRSAARPVVPFRPVSDLSSRHVKTLQDVFRQPVPADIPWRSIEALFVALGAIVVEASGSRVNVRLGTCVATFHEPHPEKVTDKGAVRSVRSFLQTVGVNPP